MGKLTCICLVILGLSSCGPSAILRLEPQSEASKWIDGKNYVYRTVDSIAIAIAFSEVQGSNIVLDVRVANGSNAHFLLSPESIYYIGTAVNPQVSDNSQIKSVFYAIDPEQVLIGVDKNMSSETRTYATTLTLNSVGAVATLVGDIAAIGKKEPKEKREQRAADKEQLYQDQRESRYRHEREMVALEDKKNYWSNGVLRKSTLDRGEHVSGRVHLPDCRQFDHIVVYIPTLNGHFEPFDFEVKHYRN